MTWKTLGNLPAKEKDARGDVHCVMLNERRELAPDESFSAMDAAEQRESDKSLPKSSPATQHPDPKSEYDSLSLTNADFINVILSFWSALHCP